MRILIDGDACPSKEVIKEVVGSKPIEMHIFVDSSHFLYDDDFIIHIVAKGKDAVDMALISFMAKGDIVITQDYGLAALAMTKADYVVNPLGFLYTKHNIDELLFKRHIAREARASGHYTKNKKRTNDNVEAFRKLLQDILSRYNTFPQI